MYYEFLAHFPHILCKDPKLQYALIFWVWEREEGGVFLTERFIMFVINI